MNSLRGSAATRVLLVCCAVVLYVLPAATQIARQATPASGRGLIVGRVIDAITGRPLRDAVVTLAGAAPAVRDDEAPRILTSADGYFVFRDLGRGPFQVRATRQGYIDGVAGRRRPDGPPSSIVLTDGQRIGDVDVRMWRPGAITGTIVDEAGELLVNIRVRAFRRTIGVGRPRFLATATATSDDRGQYRLGGLVPGDYIVVMPAKHVNVPQAVAYEVQAGRTIPPRGLETDLATSTATLILGGSLVGLEGSPVPPPGNGDRPFIYPPAFEPAALTGGVAVPLTIAAGEEREGINLQLRPVATRRVTGFVVGPDGAAGGTPVRLWPEGFEDYGLEDDATTAMADASGAFVFPAVPSGHYALRASRVPAAAADARVGSRTPLWAEVPIAVGASDVTGIVVTLNEALRIRGRVELQGTSPRTPPARLEQVAMVAQSVSGSPVLSNPLASPISGSEFSIGGLSPGRYFVRPAAAPPGWTLRSVTYNGRDVSETPLELQSEVDDVLVTFTDRWTSVRGTVRAPGGQADAGVIVVAFSTDFQAWSDFGPSPRRMRSAPTNKSGGYEIAALPAGDYYLVALPDDIAGDWRDPAVLRTLARVASQVSLRDGDPKTQDLVTRMPW